MSVTLKRERDGSWRPNWYADALVDGRRRVFNLNVPFLGKPGATASSPGSDEFEKSREEAQNALATWLLNTRTKGHAEHLIERLIESKTGTKLEHVRIANLCDHWLSLPRDAGELSHGYTVACRSGFRRFTNFMARRNRRATLLYQVKAFDVAAFMSDLRKEVSPKTVRTYLQLLRSAFTRFLPPGVANPFTGTISRKRTDAAVGGDSIHRLPFSKEELTKVFAVAREYEGGSLHGPIVTAACTAMRKGDVCRLRWSDISDDMIACKTSKTGERVEIPIFLPLRAVLAERQNNGSEYVFPEIARMLDGVKNPNFRKGDAPATEWIEKPNPDGLTWRFKNIVAKALTPPAAALEPVTPTEEIKGPGLTAIAALPEGPRREHMQDTFTRYCDGASVRQIAASTGYSKGSVSAWLSAVEGLTGKRFMRSGQAPSVKTALARVTRTTRKEGQGQRAASVRDWHALRTTFVTLALSAGVPLEIVKRITGHRTAEIVMTYYFRPDREQFRAALGDNMPAVLIGAKKTQRTAVAELDTLIAKVKSGTATENDRKRLCLVATQV